LAALSVERYIRGGHSLPSLSLERSASARYYWCSRTLYYTAVSSATGPMYLPGKQNFNGPSVVAQFELSLLPAGVILNGLQAVKDLA